MILASCFLALVDLSPRYGESSLISRFPTLYTWYIILGTLYLVLGT